VGLGTQALIPDHSSELSAKRMSLESHEPGKLGMSCFVVLSGKIESLVSALSLSTDYSCDSLKN
jgi:hypothetical protein